MSKIKKYIRNEIVGVNNTDRSDEDRETINIKQQTENNPSFKIKKNIAAEVESENQDENAEQKARSISVEKEEQSRRKRFEISYSCSKIITWFR